MKKEFYDLVYHGYGWENDSIKRQSEFSCKLLSKLYLCSTE